MIAFGASFKELEESWDVWLRKFERLLQRLAWTKAELRADFHRGARAGDTLFEYTWTRNHPTEPEWIFDGGPREFGTEAQRFRDWIPIAEDQLRKNPDDAALLIRLIEANQRLGADDRATELQRRLNAITPGDFN